MALRVLMLRKALTEAQQRLAALQEARTGFAQREAELETSINEANTPEERSAVEEAVNAFEAEQRDNAAAITAAEDEIRGIEAKIAAAEQAAAQARNQNPGALPPGREERNTPMPTASIPEQRTRFFGMTVQQRDAFFKRDDVADFLTRVRELGAQKRAVSGAELGIPDAVLELLRDNMTEYSKVIRYVTLRPVKGKARKNILGKVPEGVWTEAVNATLNELALSFTQVELDGYRVGGYIGVDNAYLEDDDNLGLGQEIIPAIGKAIGIAVDKAIVYGDRVKKPVGFITRLAAATRPAWWGDNEGAFTNLSATNLIKLDLSARTGAAFFAPLTLALGTAKPNYSDGRAVWFCNRKTHLDIKSKALAFDAAAALVAGVNNTMPVVGGDVVELDFIPDYEIVGGFLSLYLLVERAGASFALSEIPMFLQEVTLYKGSARYDGKPLIGEGFVAVNYANQNVTTSISFAPDSANTTPASGGGG